MKSIILVVIILVFIFGDGKGSNQQSEGQLITESVCEAEIERIAEENCGVAIRETFLTNLLIKYRDNEISAELFGSFASIYCIRMLGQTQCLFDILPTTLNSICKLSYAYDVKVAAARLNRVAAEFYCENNMKRLNDTLKDDGITCLFTQDFIDCKISHLTSNVLRTATANLCDSDINVADGKIRSYVKKKLNKVHQSHYTRIRREGPPVPEIIKHNKS